MYLTQPLHRAIQHFPDRLATVSQGRRRTYRELGERVAKLAGAFHQLGVKPGDRIGMLALNSDHYLEYFLAAFWAGAVVNPINTRWSAAEIVYSIKDCETTVLLVDAAFAAMAAGFRDEAKVLRHVVYTGEGPTPAGMLPYERILDAAVPIEDVYRHDGDLAGVFYTGGTTGFPKGVMLTHANLYTSALSIVAGELAPGAVCLHAAPQFHIAGNAITMRQYFSGGTHVFNPSFTPLGVMETIQNEKVTDMLLVPTMIQMLVDHPEIKFFDLSSLKQLWYGASPISAAVLARAMAALPGVDFVQAYGMTELAPIATVLPAYYHTAEGVEKAAKVRSAGRASICTEVRIVDAAGNEVPRGTVGEIAVRGPNIMAGYWNKPEETAAAIRNGWMLTGDGAYMDEDGFVYIVDRMKDMIISGGENVYSVEVENAIAQHPAVATCAVIGIPSEQWGESIHAVVILKKDAEVTEAELQAHCKKLIAGFKCPRSVEFRTALPISGAGKVLKTTLREPFWKDQKRAVN
jgi:acyl-CoA synthetase (AMP-forming)/AMP-acid ligase II